MNRQKLDCSISVLRVSCTSEDGKRIMINSVSKPVIRSMTCKAATKGLSLTVSLFDSDVLTI